MRIKSLFGTLLSSTYAASGAEEPLERYYASMFSGYFSQTDSQPSCASVKSILRGTGTVPRKLLQFYRDSKHPRCPEKIVEDLSVLAECCFAGASRRNALEKALTAFLQTIPNADAEDLIELISGEDLIHRWTCLTWYALCGDLYG